MLTNLGEGDFLFIDEIHRLPRAVEEFLYPAMEDYAVDFVFDKGLNARSHRFRLKTLYPGRGNNQGRAFVISSQGQVRAF